MLIRLLINPLAHGAYYQQVFKVAEAELNLCFGTVAVRQLQQGALEFIELNLEQQSLTTKQIDNLLKLSWVQALFYVRLHGDEQVLQVETQSAQFKQPNVLVWGSKYRGKTHELVTQLALNLTLAISEHQQKKAILLDPMAGRGTSLLWAARYGIDAYGIELDPMAAEHFERDVKRQTKLHRIKHRIEQSASKKGKRKGLGRYIEFKWADSSTRLSIGDTRQAERYVAGKRFTHLITDLPYGVQFTGSKEARSPLATVATAAKTWYRLMYTGAGGAIIFNALQPKRVDLEQALTEAGFECLPFSVPHRMSESIKRDILLIKKLQ